MCAWLIAMSDRNSTCPNCGYDITGLGRPEHCPECGIDPAPLPKSVHFDRKALINYLFTTVTLPSLTLALVIGVCVGGLGEIGMLIGLIASLFVPFFGFGLWLHTSAEAISRSRPHPRPVPLVLIPLLSLIALIPSFVFGWFLIDYLRKIGI